MNCGNDWINCPVEGEWHDLACGIARTGAAALASCVLRQGLGAEIGIYTTRLHAFGPMAAEALTVEHFVVRG